MSIIRSDISTLVAKLLDLVKQLYFSTTAHIVISLWFWEWNRSNEFDLELRWSVQLIAEVLGTYFLIFAGCMSVVVNLNNDKVVGLPGISIVWGLAVTVLVYSVGHISGAHFNPAVTLAFATCKRFPWKQVGWSRRLQPLLGSWKSLDISTLHGRLFLAKEKKKNDIYFFPSFFSK